MAAMSSRDALPPRANSGKAQSHTPLLAQLFHAHKVSKYILKQFGSLQSFARVQQYVMGVSNIVEQNYMYTITGHKYYMSSIGKDYRP